MEFNDPVSESKPIPFSHEVLNKFCRYLYLAKDKSFLISSLQESNLLKGVKIVLYRKCTEDLLPLFIMKDDLCFVMTSLNYLSNWKYHMIIPTSDLSDCKDSIKAVLLHNGNTLPYVPRTYIKTMEEPYENLRAVLTSIQYDDHNFHICADFKVVTMLVGLQLGNTRFCCSLCLWNSK